MMTSLPSSITRVGFLLSCASTAFAQAMPTSQPSVITIVREDVKLGRAEDHARNEAGWPAAYAKAKSPDFYLAFVSMTGPSEAWYVTSFASHAAMGEGMKREATDPALAAELRRLMRADAEFLSNVRVMHAVGRPDLSNGAFPDLSKARFAEVTWFRVRPGHEANFEAAAKAYGSAARRAGAATGYRVYEIMAGVPGPTYLIFATLESVAAFDQMMAENVASMKGATAEEMTTLQKFSAEGLINSETQRFRIDGAQSYVSAQARQAYPDFWLAKMPAKP